MSHPLQQMTDHSIRHHMSGAAIDRSIHASNVGGKHSTVAVEFAPRLHLTVSACSRKLKCDKTSPCSNCTKLARPCVFITSSADVDAKKRLAEVKEQMGALERSLEEDVVRLSRCKSNVAFDDRSHSGLPGQDESHSGQEDDEDTRDLKSNRFVSEDAAYYEDDVDRNDDIVDLGIAMGKVRITERIGGLVRPRFSEEVSVSLATVSYRRLMYIVTACASALRASSERAGKA
jgi:hypothetical protein